MKKSTFVLGGGLLRAVPLLPFVLSLLFTACPDPVTNNGAAVKVSLLALDGYVTAPVVGETPNTGSITADQYTGSIAWQTRSGGQPPAAFAADAAYQAVLTLAAKGSYTFAGLAPDAFTHNGAQSVTLSVANANTGCTITITFPPTGHTAGVNLWALDDLVKVPAAGATPNTEPITTAQYRGSIEWQTASGQPASAFAANTAYQAVLTLTAQGAYTFAGLPPDAFTHSLADSVTAAPGEDGAGCTITVTFETWYLGVITDVSAIVPYLQGKTSPVPLKLALPLSSENWGALLSALDTANKEVSLNLLDCTGSNSTASGGMNTNGAFDPNPAESDSRRNNGKTKIQSLILPAAAAAIPASSVPSFQGFSSLQTVRGGGIKTIGERAFSACARLSSISFPAAQSIGDRAFYSCARLGSVSLPAAQTIGDYAFMGCSSLGSVMAAEAKSIGKQAFYNCAKLESVDLPLAESIGDGALMDCARLTSVSFPAAQDIGRSAFEGCTGLQSVDLLQAQDIGHDAFLGCGKLESVSFPKAASIGNRTFSGCARLRSVSLPLAASIGNGAFTACASLRSISLGEAWYIGPNAFKDCAGLESANLPKARSIGESAFEGCTSLGTAQVINNNTSVVIVNFPAAESIGDKAFKDCTSLASANLPKARSIGEGAFAGCTSLASISLPKAESIGLQKEESTIDSAFMGCSSLVSVTLGATPPAVGITLFASISAAQTITVKIPNSASAKSGYGVPNLPETNFDNTNTSGQNWGNAFRGIGWGKPPAGGAYTYGGGAVNRHISLVFAAY